MSLKKHIMTNIELIVSDFKQISDPRKAQGKRYKLHNILTIMVLSMLSGCDDFESMALFCKEKSDFLIKNGLLDGKNYPSHDLFRYIMIILTPDTLSKILYSWLEHIELLEPVASELAPKLIHIDGKVLRATRTSEHSKTGLLVINAYLSNRQVTIGQTLADKKSCEKKAIPLFINDLHLEGAIVTIDAIATMPLVATSIIGKKADYILALKKNNKLFYQEVSDFFRCFSDTALIVDVSQTVDKQGLRTDTRTCSIITDLRFFPDAANWKNLKTLVCVKRERELNGKKTLEIHYYLTSLAANAKMLLQLIRKHWSIENELHWHLDVSFNEDKQRLREKNAVLNLAIFRRFCLALLKKSESLESIKTQRLAFAWNDESLVQFINSLIINKLYLS